MANKLYEEKSIQAIAEAIRLKLATPDGTKSDDPNCSKFDISEMPDAIKNIPVRLGFPSNAKETYTQNDEVAANGWVYCAVNARNTDTRNKRHITLTNTTKGIKCTNTGYKSQNDAQWQWNAQSGWNWNSCYNGANLPAYLMVPVSKGDKVTLTMGHTTGTSTFALYFMPEAEAEKRDELLPKTT